MPFIHLCQKSHIARSKNSLESLPGRLVSQCHRPRGLKLPDKPGHLLAGESGHPFEIPKNHALLLPSKLLMPKPREGALDKGVSFLLDHTKQALYSLQKLFTLRQRFELTVVHIDHHARDYERFDRFQTLFLIGITNPLSDSYHIG